MNDVVAAQGSQSVGRTEEQRVDPTFGVVADAIILALAKTLG